MKAFLLLFLAIMPDLATVFSTSDFIPHGHCYLWRPTLVWLHLVSDLLTALAYYSIPVSLVYFARRRQDLPFKWVFWLFGAFIVACGTTHLLDVWTLWHPTYWLSGCVKLLTALLSVATAVMLYWLVPHVLVLPSPAQIEVLNRSLQAEIVERQQIEAALRAGKASLKEAQRLAHLGNWEFDLATQKITWSEELFRIFGLDPAQPEPGYEEHLQTFHPESRQQLHATVQQTAATGAPYELELQVCRADGSVGWVLARGEAVLNSQGAVVGLFGTVLDISDRKTAEEALRNLSDRLTLALKSGAIAIWDWSMPENMLTWDDRMYELYGMTPEAFTNVYEAWANSVHPDDLPLVEAGIQQALAGEKDYDQEFRVMQPDGTMRFLKAYALVQRNAQGEPQQLVGINYDITEHKQAETLIRTALKEKEVLLQEIHHRVKNNLQIVYSLLRLQRRQLQDPQAAAVLLESQNRIEAIALVHEKLYRAGDLAHIDASEYIPNLVVNLVSTYGLHAHQVQLKLDVEPLPLSMDCAVPCGLMINELVSNAFKYAFPDQRPGQLTVTLRADTTGTPVPHVILEVADNGVGLPVHVSVGDATTLGLQLVSDFVDQLKGTLQLDSTHGTSVRVRFPQSTLRQTPIPC